METGQVGLDIRAEMNPNEPVCLRSARTSASPWAWAFFSTAKAVGLAGNGEIRAIVGRELEKDSGVRSAFVQLAG